MSKRFLYFELNGLGESVRYILHHANIEFEDVRVTEDWPTVKQNVPFGQLPMYEEGGRTITQSLAIEHYLGHGLGLNAGELWHDAQLDSVALTINDLWIKAIEILKMTDEDKKAAAKKVFMEETVDYYFSRFETKLKEKKTFFGGKLTWVDFTLVGRLEALNLFFDTSFEAKCPTIKALVAKIHSSPRVKSYVATRKPYKSPFQ